MAYFHIPVYPIVDLLNVGLGLLLESHILKVRHIALNPDGLDEVQFPIVVQGLVAIAWSTPQSHRVGTHIGNVGHIGINPVW